MGAVFDAGGAVGAGGAVTAGLSIASAGAAIVWAGADAGMLALLESVGGSWLACASRA